MVPSAACRAELSHSASFSLFVEHFFFLVTAASAYWDLAEWPHIVFIHQSSHREGPGSAGACRGATGGAQGCRLPPARPDPAARLPRCSLPASAFAGITGIVFTAQHLGRRYLPRYRLQAVAVPVLALCSSTFSVRSSRPGRACWSSPVCWGLRCFLIWSGAISPRRGPADRPSLEALADLLSGERWAAAMPPPSPGARMRGTDWLSLPTAAPPRE